MLLKYQISMWFEFGPRSRHLRHVPQSEDSNTYLCIKIFPAVHKQVKSRPFFFTGEYVDM